MLKSNNTGCIYIFINNINNKKYVGQTWNFSKRIREHFNGYGYAKLLKYALNKYGHQNFTVKKIYKCNNQIKLDFVETYLIKIFNSLSPNGYNLALGGSRGKHNEESKKLIGSYHKNKIVSEETRKKQSDKAKGKIISDSTKEKIKERLISNAENKNKPVYFYNIFTHQEVIKFENINDVKKNINFPLNRIYGSISAKSKFKYNDLYCYASYDSKPSDIEYSIGRKIIINDDLGNEYKFNSIKEAEHSLNLNRGIIDSLVRGLSKKSKYIKNNKLIKFTAKYI